jgi:Protein of unknown function (DUF3667)
MPEVLDGIVTRCASCSEPLSGPYCANCGERVVDADSLTVRHFVTRTLPQELFDLDGKMWRTLRHLILQPGFLSAEYSAGRRTVYLTPLRLLLTSIVIYALATQGGFLVRIMLGPVTLNIAPTAVQSSLGVAATVKQIDRFGVLERRLAVKQRTADVSSDAARVRFHDTLNRFAQPVSFANVLLLSLALHAAFRRRRPLLLHNATFAMHIVSFVLLSSVLLVPTIRGVAMGNPVNIAVILTVFVWQAFYIGAAVRAYYFAGDASRSWPRTRAAAAAVLIYIVNSAFVTVVQVVGAAIAIHRL